MYTQKQSLVNSMVRSGRDFTWDTVLSARETPLIVMARCAMLHLLRPVGKILA
jgi:hypothetical protein